MCRFVLCNHRNTSVFPLAERVHPLEGVGSTFNVNFNETRRKTSRAAGLVAGKGQTVAPFPEQSFKPVSIVTCLSS